MRCHFALHGAGAALGDARPAPRRRDAGRRARRRERPPPTAAPQSYPPEQVDAGRTRFAAQCGFCHGRDAAGGEGGTDLTRSALVAADVRGDKIGPVVRSGRPDKGMPAFTLSDADLTAIVAFIHDQKTQADSAIGGRRASTSPICRPATPTPGKRYFDDARARGAIRADRRPRRRRHALQGLPLLQRMLYPGRAAAAPARRRRRRR